MTPTVSPTPTTTVTPGGKKLDLDGDGEVDALTDGLLLLRRLFGFSAQALDPGAVDMDCTRCDAPSIEGYIADNLALFDVDDDGEFEALTDGLLALRGLFGFTGNALITGAVDQSDCMRWTRPRSRPTSTSLRCEPPSGPSRRRRTGRRRDSR